MRCSRLKGYAIHTELAMVRHRKGCMCSSHLPSPFFPRTVLISREASLHSDPDLHCFLFPPKSPIEEQHLIFLRVWG